MKVEHKKTIHIVGMYALGGISLACIVLIRFGGLFWVIPSLLFAYAAFKVHDLEIRPDQGDE